jgi:hypothetical protein
MLILLSADADYAELAVFYYAATITARDEQALTNLAALLRRLLAASAGGTRFVVRRRPRSILSESFAACMASGGADSLLLRGKRTHQLLIRPFEVSMRHT